MKLIPFLGCFSAHKNSIAASVEDFLDDNQNVAIDVHDLRLLDAIISDSILKKGESNNTQSSDMSGGRSKSASSGLGNSKVESMLRIYSTIFLSMLTNRFLCNCFILFILFMGDCLLYFTFNFITCRRR